MPHKGKESIVRDARQNQKRDGGAEEKGTKIARFGAGTTEIEAHPTRGKKNNHHLYRKKKKKKKDIRGGVRSDSGAREVSEMSWRKKKKKKKEKGFFCRQPKKGKIPQPW